MRQRIEIGPGPVPDTRLLVLRLAKRGEKNPSQRRHNLRCWVCLCACGKTTVVPHTSITSGRTRSCGCLRSETSSRFMTRVGRASRDQTRPDLTTFPPFGRLTVREWDGTRWLCDCTCGGSIRLTTSNLLYNHVVRCEACRKPATHCAICHGPIVDRPVNATLCGDADCLREYNRRKQAESRENRKASRSPSEV